ncbi:MAG: hypothetical protein US98_C0039G0001, partial [Parcubacteria group bacterium GW2011_GWC1_38_6]
MTIFYLLFLILFIVLSLFLIFAVIVQGKKRKWSLIKGMNLSLLLVTLPQAVEKEKEFSLEVYLKTVEGFYSSLNSIRESSRIKRSFFGNPFFVFEIAVHRIGEAIHFYVASPRQFSQLMEKHILGFWPNAQIQPVSDYNIFNPNGKSVGSTARLSKGLIFPLKPYQELSNDPLSTVTSIFTKLAKEGEGAAIQIIARP